jgi:hypothetical protein
MVELGFLGGTGTVTGSKYLLRSIVARGVQFIHKEIRNAIRIR